MDYQEGVEEGFRAQLRMMGREVSVLSSHGRDVSPPPPPPLEIVVDVLGRRDAADKLRKLKVVDSLSNAHGGNA